MISGKMVPWWTLQYISDDWNTALYNYISHYIRIMSLFNYNYIIIISQLYHNFVIITS